MKRIVLAVGLTLALAVAPVRAQTRVSVAVGFGVPRPYVSGLVVVGRPFVYYPAPALVVVRARRPHFHRRSLVVVRRVYVVRPYRRSAACRKVPDAATDALGRAAGTVAKREARTHASRFLFPAPTSRPRRRASAGTACADRPRPQPARR